MDVTWRSLGFLQTGKKRVSDLLRIVFWNVNKKNLNHYVCSITASTNADVVVLLENGVSSKETLQSLRVNVSPNFYYPRIISTDREKFHCFCRNPELDLSEIHSELRMSARLFQIGQHKALLVLVHGHDIRNHGDSQWQFATTEIADTVKLLQNQKHTNKLILLGDFNLNPFDWGMNDARGLNAMMTKACVKSGRRTLNEKEYDFYYNPMWSLFGDNTDGPAGTIYNTSGQGFYGWSMLDQVIVHHSVVEFFGSVKIVTKAGTKSLLSRSGHPDANNASDHFPILVEFCEEGQ